MQVVNVKKNNLNKLNYKDFIEWSANTNHLYIGRDMSYYVPGTYKSKWHNPFPVKNYGLDECLILYEEHIRDNLYSDLPELEGKILGCWCHPNKCHGDILIKLLKEIKK